MYKFEEYSQDFAPAQQKKVVQLVERPNISSSSYKVRISSRTRLKLCHLTIQKHTTYNSRTINETLHVERVEPNPERKNILERDDLIDRIKSETRQESGRKMQEVDHFFNFEDIFRDENVCGHGQDPN